jgi:hypothetical protein
MSVEQTTQLIQLILNSVLMSVACALVLGGLAARYAAIGGQLQVLNQILDPLNLSRFGCDRLDGDIGARESTFLSNGASHIQSRKYFRRLQQAYRMTRNSLIVAYYSLFFSVSSCFVLAFRGMVDWNWLIPAALILFVLCVATLLVSIGLVLIDLHSSDRPLLEEISKLVGGGSRETDSRSRLRSRPSALKDKNLRDKSLRGKTLREKNLRNKSLKTEKYPAPRQQAG